MSRSNFLYQVGPFKAALAVAGRLPLSFSRWIARTIARCAAPFLPSGCHAALANLQLITGLSGSALQSLCDTNILNFATMLADYFYASSATPAEILAMATDAVGMQHIEAALAKGKGGILITAHLGNWELGGMLLAAKGIPMSVVTLAEPSSQLSTWREDYRRRLGIRTITIGTDKFAFVEIIGALKRNEFVAMLVDRPTEEAAIPVEFFGNSVPFSSGPALLWQHTGAAVLPAFVLQRANGYISFVEPALPMVQDEDPKTAIACNTQLIASAFENLIREHADQYYNYSPIMGRNPQSARG